MKKISLIILLLVCFLAAAASAWGDSPKEYLRDSAGLLTDQESASLSGRLLNISQERDIDVVIVTINGTDGKTDRDFADDFYDYNGYGDDGLLLLINLNPRGWYISTSGSCIYYFTDYGIQKIGESIRPNLSSGNYAAALNQFVDLIPNYLNQGESGKPIDIPGATGGVHEEIAPRQFTGRTVVVMLLLALALALITVRVLAGRMNTVRRQASAKAYEQGFNLTQKRDIYLYSHTTSQRIESSGGSSGGSSTHTGSSGRSHGGGGGKF
ncbi:MAG: TPM domain-containing protein [Clostridiales bacterium]|nr:TPM domain-containing protein [Clostridiales bacterium]MDR2713218.1 TPM domain-containing protein [Clostridiales bacterium]